MVNLNYKQAAKVTLRGPGPIEVFDCKSGRWHPMGSGTTATIQLAPGRGVLVRTVR
jgi:hypothetical protein